ncbi:MAG: hypothetical protein HY716_02870 [Planctomycetes bacterium]|nr:hypothetical protein [Planctomycetota bacterium]
MSPIKKFNAALWGGNALLLTAITVFSLQFLILPEPKSYLTDIEPPRVEPASAQGRGLHDYGLLRNLPNPLRPPKNPSANPVAVSDFHAKVIGADRVAGDPNSAVAYLFVPTRNLYVNAYMDEPIRDPLENRDVPELAGWRLVGITTTHATFTSGQKEATLPLQDLTLPPPATQSAGSGARADHTPWDKSKYQSKLTRSTDQLEIWQIDRDEAAWLMDNWKDALQGVTLSSYPQGGLKVDALPGGGVAAERGLRVNDVIRSINGHRLDNVQKVEEILRRMPRHQQSIQIMLDRAGRRYTLHYNLARPGR